MYNFAHHLDLQRQLPVAEKIVPLATLGMVLVMMTVTLPSTILMVEIAVGKTWTKILIIAHFVNVKQNKNKVDCWRFNVLIHLYLVEI